MTHKKAAGRKVFWSIFGWLVVAAVLLMVMGFLLQNHVSMPV